MSNKKRINWIDYAKAISIFCVVLIHANIPYPTRGFIRIFLIPLFFFLSGIFANTQRYISFRDFFINKGLHILIPYLFFNILTYLFWVFVGRNFGYDADSSIEWWRPLLGIIYGEYSHLTHYIPLWFLACLFSVECLYYIIFRNIKTTLIYWLTVVSLGIVGGINYAFNPIALPWGLSIAFPMMVFYAVGAFFSPRIIANDYRILHIKNTGIWMIVSFVSMLLVYHFNTGEVCVFKNEYGNYILFYIGAFSGILFMHIICRWLEYLEKYLSWLSYIGKNTLIILCLHLLIFSFIKGITFWLFDLPLDIYSNTWVIIGSSILNIALLVPIIALINRYCPFLIGKFD